ncbi:alpha/beta hydrolase [Microbacterium sp.]|uniref:alpha/beta hydrolase n=1 Tax=Microbacterium sp. TaxID=51671 RepID=UPI00092B9181|nr:alpha/beta hydrolase [Microbacterium sp.]MBN9189271.1 alpha/beta hydrolase [Microbacterium sp.]MBN9193909.1 alpha/beta hydrolase [Microbacterium sp.]OJU70127.1 MAG: hypothetical protein BGO04_05435 [Microbacterium sp. 70-38]
MFDFKSEIAPRAVDPAIERHIARFDALMAEPGLEIDDARERYASLLAERSALGAAVATRDLSIPTRHGAIPARLYSPEDSAALLVYMHGGGFAVGDLDSPDPVLHAVSREAGVSVLSLSYALAPEHMYPVAYEQCQDALVWANAHREHLDGPRKPLGIAGDSAGGNLTALLSHWAATTDGPELTWQALINPVLDFLALDGALVGSHRLYGQSPMLSTETMRGFMASYFPNRTAKIEASPLRSIADYSLLPTTFVAVGQCDALRDEGIAYAVALAAAGVPVSLEVYSGMTHNFLTLTDLSVSARRFVEDLVRGARRWAHR